MIKINDRFPDFYCNIMKGSKIIRRQMPMKFIPRVGETIYLVDGKYKVTEVIHMFIPHDINVKVKLIDKLDGEEHPNDSK